MGTRTVPVTPAVVGWAIEEDGRPLQDLADAIGVDVDVLRAWTEGEAEPTIGQTSELAKALGRPRSLFLLPQPPRTATLPASFRRPPGGDDAATTADVLKQMRRARRIQHAAAWALRDQPPVEVPSLTTGVPAAKAAQVACVWLAQEGTHYPDEWAAWRERRRALEDRDLLVFSLALGREAVRGFSAWDDRAPLIVVNSTGNGPQVRSFTLMHELGHLMLRRDAACLQTEGRALPDAEVERWCESFAAAVLMPAAVVEDVVDRVAERGPAAFKTVRSLARRCWVSNRAAALRLIDLGYAQYDLYAAVNAAFRPGQAAAGGGSGERRHEARLRELGERPLQLVLGSLQPRDALSVLRLQVNDVRSLEAELPSLRTAL